MAKKGGTSPNNLRFATERTVQVNLWVTGSQVSTEGNLKRCKHDIEFRTSYPKILRNAPAYRIANNSYYILKVSVSNVTICKCANVVNNYDADG